MSIMIDHEENAPCMNPVEFGFFYLISDNFTHFFLVGQKLHYIRTSDDNVQVHRKK